MDIIFTGNVIHAHLHSQADMENLIRTIHMHKESLQGLLRALVRKDISQHLVHATMDATLDSVLSLGYKTEGS
jgi:hypothetical protein